MVSISQFLSFSHLFILLTGVAATAVIASIICQRRLGEYRFQLDRTIADKEFVLTSLKEQETRHQILVQSVPDCIMLLSKDGSIQQVNAAGLSMLEATHEDLIVGQSIYDIIEPAYREKYNDLIERIFQGSPDMLEFETAGADSDRRWLEMHAVPLRNHVHEIIALLGIIRDITERKRIAEKYTEKEIHLRTIIESEPECVKLQSRDGVILDMNPAGLALLDAKDPKEVIGQPIYKFLCREYREPYRRLTERVFNGNKEILEFQADSTDGTRRWYETNAAPLCDSDGAVTALLAITRDITERKLSEEKLRQRQMDLFHVSRLSAMGEMASTLAHELNQPLCAISGYAEICAKLIKSKHSSNEKLDETFNLIVNQAERASQIIRRLREFVSKKAPRIQPTDIQQLLHNVVELMRPDLDAHAVEVSVESSLDLPCILADSIQIEQVIVNLIRNSIDAMCDQTGNRRVTIATRMRDNKMLEISVRDNGPGISTPLSTKVMNPYYTTKEHGLGIGLSICRSIIEAHSGRFWFDDKFKQGARFNFSLPLDA